MLQAVMETETEHTLGPNVQLEDKAFTSGHHMLTLEGNLFL